MTDSPHVHFENRIPQSAPGTRAARGHKLENSIPLSIFPVQAADKFCFCFCGLPGRGKTHIARRLAKYLSFFHAVPVEVYTASEFRRQRHGGISNAEFFNPNNLEAARIRDECNAVIIEKISAFLTSTENGIAILDSTNPTHERRRIVIDKIQKNTGAKVMFIEVINEDVKFLEGQYKSTAQRSEDYTDVDYQTSLADYRQKVDNYKAFYEPVNSGDNHLIEMNWTYMKCDHSKQYFVINKARGYLQQKVVNFIMNLRTTSHSFYLSRHGQSEYNDLGRIGGDSGLTKHGIEFAKRLSDFVEKEIVIDKNSNEKVPCRLWTSTMRRTIETTQFIKTPTIIVKDPHANYEWIQMRRREWHHLDELFAGLCDGMTYAEIEEKFPEEWELRKGDKLAYRYPRGESYLDVIARLEPIIIEMERHQEPLLIVAHQGILRIIYAFYMGYSRNDAPHLSIPLNTVIELRPGAVECLERRVQLYHPSKDLPVDGQDEPLGKVTRLLSDDTDPPSH